MTAIKRAAATTAAALVVLVSGTTISPAFGQPPAPPEAARPNSQPPPLPPGTPPPPAPAKPAPDLPYKRNAKQCIVSTTDGASVVRMPWGQLNLRIAEAHRFATGQGVTVAVIDTGVNQHPLLAGRVRGGGDYVGNGPDNTDGTNDCDGHGTQVAGIIGASKSADTDFIGVAPNATILAIRQTSDRFEFEGNATTPKRTTAGKVSTLAQAIVTAANSGAKVINISLTNCSTPKDFSQDDRNLQAAIKWAVDVKNIVIITAAGNLGEQESGCSQQNNKLDVDSVNVIASPPWFAQDVLSVASMSQTGRVSDFSVWGPWVSIAGPGEDIVTIDPKGPGVTNATPDPQNRQLIAIRGTSYAAPYVAGVTALIRERFPQLTARQVMARLTSTAQNPGSPSGWDRKVGHGMVSPVAALTAVLPAELGNERQENRAPIFTSINTGPEKDWVQVVVALSGLGIGIFLLFVTMFVRNTIRRKRKRRVA